MHRSLLDRPSTDTRPTCRSTIDRESTDVFIELPLMSAEVSTVTISGAYRSTTGGISVNYRRNVVVYHSIVERESTDTMCRSIERYYRPIYRPILDTIYPYIDRYYQLLLSTDPRYYRPMYQPIYWLILDPIHRYIDWYQILLTDTRYYRPMYRPMYQQMHRPILEHLSTARVSVECRRMYELGEASVQYRWSISEVSVNH